MMVSTSMASKGFKETYVDVEEVDMKVTDKKLMRSFYIACVLCLAFLITISTEDGKLIEYLP